MIIEHVLAMRRIDGVQPWPGTTFDVHDIEGQALLGTSSVQSRVEFN